MPRLGSAGEQPPAKRKPRRSKRGNGEGSIYLRKDGRWTAAYFVPKPGGGESRRYVYGRTPEEVETKLVEMRKQVQAGAPLAPAGLTVARYLEERMEQVAAPRVRPKTARSHRDLIAKYLVPKLGRKRLGQLGARDVFLALRSRGTVWASERRSWHTRCCGRRWRTPCGRRSSRATWRSWFGHLGR